MTTILDTRTGCPARGHDTGYAYRKLGCRCHKARQAEYARKNHQPNRHQRRRRGTAEANAYHSFAALHRTGAYVLPGVPDFHWDPARGCVDVDPDVMFPTEVAGIPAAQRVCRHCPFKQACHDWAVETAQIAGVWGGVAETERRRAIYDRLRATGGVRCPHVWPGELTPDARCEVCGLAYADWSEEDDTE